MDKFPSSQQNSDADLSINETHDISDLDASPSLCGTETSPKYDEIELSVTESQYAAITRPLEYNQIFRIHAGPGSGKTFTLVARIAQLLNDGVKPHEILVLSMANRSVDSLKDMLSKITGVRNASEVEISTFHSFCAGLLEQHGSMINVGYTKQNIFDETMWKTMIAFFSGKSVKFGQHTIGGTITPVRLGKAVSSIMVGSISVEEVAAQHKLNPEYLASLVHHLRSSGLVRYDELIADATRLMRFSASRLRKNNYNDDNDNDNDYVTDNNDIETQSQYFIPRLANYKAVFVDEFQDVYPSLANVVKCIVEYPTTGLEGATNNNKHLTITGDPSQSIYEFLGAYEKDMLCFHTKLPNMEVQDHQLLESFRCTQPILDAAVTISLKSPDLKLTATRTGAYAQKPVLLHSRSSVEELHHVADEIVRLLCASGGQIHLEDIAVLTKTNEAAIAMQSMLKTRYGLRSFKLSSGNQWVASRLHILKHVLGVIAGDSSASVSLMSILLNLDSETGSRKRVSKLFSESVSKSIPGDGLFLETYLFEELSHVETTPKSALATLYKKYPGILAKMAAFLNQVQKEREILAETHARDPLEYGPSALVSCLQRMASLDGISQFLQSDAKETSKATPLEILESFNDSIHHAYSKFKTKREFQSMTFLDYFLQTYDSEVSHPIGNSIKVSTIHSAKGLEFPIVFILGQTMYSASWDKTLEEEVSAKTEQTEQSEQIGQDSSATDENTAPNSVSRLLYVALTRARNLVYVGHRKPWKELPHMTKTLFTNQVPSQVLSDELDITAQDISGEQGRELKSPLDPQNAIEKEICASDTKSQSANTSKSPEILPMPLLASLCHDVGRPIPSPQKIKFGLDLLERISRKPRPEIPGADGRKRGFPHPSKPKYYQTLKSPISHPSSNVNHAARKTFGWAKSAFLKRGP